MDLKDWVKAARAHKGWTLEAMGAAMGRSKATAGFWEKGDTAPSYAQVRKLSELTGYPMPEIEISAAGVSPSLGSAALGTGVAAQTPAEPVVPLEPALPADLSQAIAMVAEALGAADEEAQKAFMPMLLLLAHRRVGITVQNLSNLIGPSSSQPATPITSTKSGSSHREWDLDDDNNIQEKAEADHGSGDTDDAAKQRQRNVRGVVGGSSRKG